VQIDLEKPIEQIFDDHFKDLAIDTFHTSEIKGGQTAADKALSEFSVGGYAQNRSQVLPESTRGASVLSPYIRHNLLPLQRVWKEVGGPFRDISKFQDELLWQEYSRHLYARVGADLFKNFRFEVPWKTEGYGWRREMLCIDTVVNELETRGWLVNQSRMWLASEWTVHNQKGWLHGQEEFYRHLLDGSRAANLAGWQWTVGSGTGRPYGFSRWQVNKRAPGLCSKCPLNKNCPVEQFPEERQLERLDKHPLIESDPNPNHTAGPSEVVSRRKPEAVFLTIESLGDADRALTAHPGLPVVFVFHKPALEKLKLSSKRINFYLETLKDLSNRREIEVYLEDPKEVIGQRAFSVTWAPVPSFKKYESDFAELHPWPWLRKPHAGSVRSFSAWRAKL
jgi:deoxyribodipyrimidine photo-lyase